GAAFTYQEVKETELGQGLDIQGGMQVTLAISPMDIVEGLSGNSSNAIFNAVLEESERRANANNERFLDVFYEVWQEKSNNQRLSTIFATAANRGRISLESTDNEILSILNTEI